MKSVQESKNELEAAVRYAENAISSAKQTIESMEFRQEMAKKQHDERTGREEALTKQVQELNALVQFHIDREAGFLDQIKELNEEVAFYTKKYNELVQQKEASSGPCGCQAYRDLEEKVGDLKVDLKDQRDFDNEVRDAVKEFSEQLGTIGFEGA